MDKDKNGKIGVGACLKKIFKDKKSATKILLLCISIAFAAISLATVIYYITGPAEGYFHSDCTDSLYWAEAAVDAGGVFNENFEYAGLLPFSATVWLAPLIKLFGVTMQTHIIGMVIFALLLFSSVIFLCRSMKWSYSFSFFTAGAMLLMLSASEKMREIMWEHVIYYSLGLLVLFTGMGLMIRMCGHFENGNVRKAWIYAAVFFVFMTLSATNGLQCLAIYTLSMFAAIAAEITFNSKEKIFSAHNKYYIFAAALLAGSAALGLILLRFWQGDIVAAYANGYSLLDGVDDWVNNLLKFPRSYLSLCGVQILDGDAVGEIATVLMLVRLFAALMVLLLPLILLFNYKKIQSRNIKLVLWMHIAVSAVIMFGFVCGRLAAGNWRLIPMVGTSIAASFATIKFMFDSKEGALSFRRVGAIMLMVSVLCSFVNCKEIISMPKDYGKDDAKHVLAEFLVDNGLEYGYADFWTAHATTVIADSEVKIRSVTISREEGICVYTYQSNINWFYDQEGIDEYFIVMTEYEYGRISDTPQWAALMNHQTRKLVCGNFNIFVFDVNPCTFQG